MQIRQLEEDLKVPLFDRLGRTTHLTAAGEILEEQTLRIFGIVREIYQSILMGADYYETPEQKKRNWKDGISDVVIGRNCLIRGAIID